MIRRILLSACALLIVGVLSAQTYTLDYLSKEGARIGRMFRNATKANDVDAQNAALAQIDEILATLKTQEQVDRLTHFLSEEQYANICQALKQRGMPTGFCCLFYGTPGTGKTETTMQLAKKTGRDVFCIDFSKIKSKWVGDSEKAIKGVFNIYRTLCKTKPVKPILFFNEADAIFGKRMENVESSAAQMLNTMQNIILQEMENLEGILICTTNLHGNLDSAFERRFIYKIELEKPGEEVRAKIWNSMMKELPADDCAILARRYPFSGGQIENVVRKSAVEYILSGTKPTVNTICKFCEEENFKSKVRRVGF